MVWPLIIGAVASVASAAIQADAAKHKTAQGGAGVSGLGGNGFSDFSMNNSGWTVTTSGSVARVDAASNRTTSPTQNANPNLGQTPLIMGASGSGLDMQTIMILGIVVLLAMKKKG